MGLGWHRGRESLVPVRGSFGSQRKILWLEAVLGIFEPILDIFRHFGGLLSVFRGNIGAKVEAD